jgi:hypothetical protein
MRPHSFDRQQPEGPYPMITRQLLSGGAFWTNYPSGRQTTPSSQRQCWRVPALRDLGVSHIARRRDVELMGHPRRARAVRRSTGSHARRLLDRESLRIFPTAMQLAASPAGNRPADATTARAFETS